MATSQILSDGKFSWSWLYVSLAVAVLALLYTEVWSAPSRAAQGPLAQGGRRVYLRQLRASVRDMETVGVATQSEFVLRMRHVYVDVSLSSHALHAATGEPYLGAVPGGDTAAGLGDRRSLKSVITEAEGGTAARVLVVIGAPGSGKTTLARSTALELCERRWWRRGQLPVLIYLRDHASELLADQQPSLAQISVSAPSLEGKITSEWLEHRLDSGGCVVLLDGLDEVADPAERGRVVAWVARQTDRHPNNTYVVTSRPHGYQSNPLPRAEVLQVRRFTPDQIKQFLHQWSYATEQRARTGTEREIQVAATRNAADLISRLRSRPALYDLAANPLLLTMTANVHRYRGQLPGSRAELYAEMCDVLLHRRFEARGLHDATGLSGPHKQHIVQYLALAMMKDQARYWRAGDAAEAIRSPLSEVPGDVEPDLFLDEARKSGLLVEREHGVYEFAHLTLQEYLAAAQLSTPRSDVTLLTVNVDNPWWRETILLWAAGNDATDVVLACLDARTVPALALAFDCADQARTIDPAARSRLEALFSEAASNQNTNPEFQRLLAGILAARTLRDTVQLNDETALCTRPVPEVLYTMFVRDEESRGLQHSHGADSSPTGDPNAPAVGMQAGEAERFADWANGVTGDGTNRLPSPDELSDLGVTVSQLHHHTIWASNEACTTLYQPPRAHWPYIPRPPRSPSVPTQPYSTIHSDHHRLSAYPYILVATRESRAQVEAVSGLLSAALSRAPEDQAGLRENLDHSLLGLALDLAFGFCLADASAAPSEHLLATPVLESTGHRLTLTGDQNRSLERARDLADVLNKLHHYGDLAPQALATVDYALALTPSLDEQRRGRTATPRLEALQTALGIVLDRARCKAIALDPEPSLDAGAQSVQSTVQAVNHALSMRSLATECLRIIAPVLQRTAGLTVTPRLPSQSLLRPFAVPARRFMYNTDEQNIALAIELALDSHVHTAAPKCALAALHVLHELASDAAHIADQPVKIEGFVHDRMRRFLERSADSRTATGTRHPEDPAGCLAEVQRLLQKRPDTPEQVSALLDQASDLLMAVRSCRAPRTALTMGTARTALLAALISLQASDADFDAEQWSLYRTWQTLAVQDRSIAALHPYNQVLLIARTQS
ncbi:NACHT domain-containing protein [Streptomyces lasiicapitis]|uniref:NACHT domain-containing protein n=1 Tax=Streptomyces lasiicapitis TaxID=1923961 RepID=UPI0036494065